MNYASVLPSNHFRTHKCPKREKEDPHQAKGTRERATQGQVGVHCRSSLCPSPVKSVSTVDQAHAHLPPLAQLTPREREKEDPSLKPTKERVLCRPIPLRQPIPHPHRPIPCPRPLLIHPSFSGYSVDPPPLTHPLSSPTHPLSSPTHLHRPICLHSFPSRPTSFLFPQDLGFSEVHIVCFYFVYMIWLR